ncbi:MAG: DEAD/DEAH box helicase [Candidatus Sumerlaeia bacterium]|nr:DEAD/DEAH box helicase [Candidatus Sumerlaeia bacterium]
MPHRKSTDAPAANPRFEDLGLSPELLRAIHEAGWKQPTPIQSASIPIILKGDDLMGVAQTGTGKTGAFVLPIVQRLGAPQGRVRALALVPTRELALQVAGQLETFATPLGLPHAAIYGGAPIGPQRMALKNGVDLLVATPGRLLDLMERMLIVWRDLRFLVLDEADRMLDMGFLPDIERILRKLPMARQTLLFTATLPPDIRRLARDHMLEPQEIDVGVNRSLAEGITEWLYPVREDQKTALLLALIEELDIGSGLIFCRTKIGADSLARALRNRGRQIGLLHADRPQAERETTLQQFRAGFLPLLVATDVASRGLDISGVTHVINYDVPQSPDDYIHRAGRTARGEAKGDAITLVTPREERLLAAIENLTRRKFERSILAGFPYRGDPLGRQSEPRRESRRPFASPGRRRGSRHHGPGHSRNR